MELSCNLAADATDNLIKVDKNRFLEGYYNVICADAGKYEDIDLYNYFFIYNSFPEVVMKEVVSNIEKSFKRKPRQVRVLYLYPEFPDVLNNNTKWERIMIGSKLELRGGMHVFQNK